METLKENLSRYQLESEEAYDTEKAMDDLLFFSRTVVSEFAETLGEVSREGADVPAVYSPTMRSLPLNRHPGYRTCWK